MDDFQGWHMKLMANRDHAASITTLSLESHHRDDPNVSFVHNFPGITRGNFDRCQSPGSCFWFDVLHASG